MNYREIAQKFVERDKDALEEFRDSGFRGIEARLAFVAGRAEDTATVLILLLNKLADEEEKKLPPR